MRGRLGCFGRRAMVAAILAALWLSVLPAQVWAQTDQAVFYHHGILYTIAPQYIRAEFEGEALTLQFSTNVKALNSAALTQTEYGYMLDYGSVKIKVTIPHNMPKVKLTFAGSGKDISKFHVKVIGEDTRIGQTKSLAQDAYKVKLSRLKFDWSDAKGMSPKFSGDTLSFDVSGAFEIDPEIGADEGSFTLPRVLTYQNGQVTYASDNVTYYYYANASGAWYNATTYNDNGAGFLIIPKGTTIDSAQSQYITYTFPNYREWQYYVNVTVVNSGTTLTNYPVKVTLNTQSLISQGKMRSDGGDIRFITTSGTLLNYYVESGINTANTIIWVLMPSIPNGNTTIVMLYGNPTATSQSSETAVFPYKTTFHDGSNMTGWTFSYNLVTGGSAPIFSSSSGYIRHDQAANTLYYYAEEGSATYIAAYYYLDFNFTKKIKNLIISTYIDGSFTYYSGGYIYSQGGSFTLQYKVGSSYTNIVSSSFSTAPVLSTTQTILSSWTDVAGIRIQVYTYGSCRAGYALYNNAHYSRTDYLNLTYQEYPSTVLPTYVGSEANNPTTKQSASYASASLNSTHNIITVPYASDCHKTISALLKWSSPNAVYDLQVSPTLMIPSTTISAKALLKDPYGNPLNTQATIYLLNAQGQTVNQTVGTTTNGWLNVTFTAPATNGYYYIQAVSNDPNYKGVLSTQIQVSDGFYITVVSEEPGVYYKQPNTLLSVTLRLLYVADNSSVPGAEVRLYEGSLLLDTQYTNSSGYATVKGTVPNHDFTWRISANTSQSSNFINLDYEINALSNALTVEGDYQNMVVKFNTTVMKGLITRHHIALYQVEEGDGSFDLWLNATANNVKIPLITVFDTSLRENDEFILAAHLENYNPTWVHNATLVLSIRTATGQPVMDVTFDFGDVKPASAAVRQVVTTFKGVLPYGTPPLAYTYSFTCDIGNATSATPELFPVIVTDDHVRVLSAVIITDVWGQHCQTALKGDPEATYLYATAVDMLGLTNITKARIEIPYVRECTLRVWAEPYTVESNLNFTVNAEVAFNTSPPSSLLLCLQGEGVNSIVQGSNHSWALTAPVKPLYALSPITYRVRAMDQNGFVYAESTVTVDVFNFPPKVFLNSPREGAILNGTIAVDLDVQDDSGVADVQYRIDDGQWQILDAPYDFELDTAKLLDGRHILYVKAVDRAGFTQISQFYFYSQNGELLWQWQGALQQILGLAANISFPVFLGFGAVMIILGYSLAKIRAKKPQPPIVVQVLEKKGGKK